MSEKQDKILINILETEKTVLTPASEVAKVDGTGNLKVVNSSDSHRLWNLVLNLDETVRTENLNNKYKNPALEPKSIWNFDYQVSNLKDPILELRETFDVSRNDEGVNHNLVLNTKNEVLIKLALKNLTDEAIQNIEIIKNLPEYCRESKIEASSIGTSDLDLNTRVVTWKIPDLAPNGEGILEIGARGELSDSQLKSGNDIDLTYKADMTSRSRISPSITALTDTLTSVDSEEDDSSPGMWNCEVEFENESDFELTINDLKVNHKVVTGEELIVDIHPEMIVPSNQAWTHQFKIRGVNVPVLAPKLDFTANYLVHSEINGTIKKEASTFKVLETKVNKIINPPTVNANANTNIEITDVITNVGTSNINHMDILDSIPRDFEVPDIEQIVANIEDADGNVLDNLRDNATYKISPEGKELTASHKISMSFTNMDANYGPGCKLVAKYPLIARNPQPNAKYETPVDTTSYTIPKGPGFVQSTDGIPEIGIAYVKRKIKTAKSITPSGTEGVFKILIKITNKGGVELQNLSVKEVIPAGFKAVDYQNDKYPSDFTEGPGGSNSQLLWKIPMLDAGSSMKLVYNAEGMGEFPRYEPVVEVAQTESMKGVQMKAAPKVEAPAEVPVDDGPKEPEVKIISEGEDSGPDARLKCPSCGSKKIATREDRNTPISYMSGVPIYGKKNSCKDCGYEWK